MWAFIEPLLQPVVALAAAGLIEGVGLPWPGIVIMATAGTAGDDWRSVLLLTLTFSVAYTAGSLIQYAVGRLLGSLALGWLSEQQRAKLEGLLGRYGMGAVCWARPLAIGNYLSIPAGMLKMNPVRFALYTFVGALPWAGGTILAGRFLGEQLASLQGLIDPWMLPGLGLLALGAAGAMLLRLMRRRWARRPVTDSL